MPNPWLHCTKIPRGPAAALAALHLDEPHWDLLTDRQWEVGLDWCDRHNLTLPLRDRMRDRMPESMQLRVDENYRKNLIRLRNIEETYRNIAAWLAETRIEFVPLKGLTHCMLFGSAPETRVQYDIDLYVPPANIHAAQAVLVERGYQPVEDMDRFPTDHLPVLIRKTQWQWRGDYYDPEIPLSIELHFRFWNEDLERLRAVGVDDFWSRRSAGLLHPTDALAYAGLHLLKHLLQGSAKAFHIYEIARILDAYADNDAFWSAWQGLHPPELRRLQAVCFGLARAWFGGRAAAIVEEEIARLPAGSQAWLRDYAASPAISEFHPNKDHLWLHLSLLESRRDQFRVARIRLIPRNLPPRGAGLGYAASRLRHHVISLPKAALTGTRWWWRANTLGSQFWIFLAAAVVFNLALFIFFMLYNLFLMDLGFREDFLGLMNGAQRAGSMAGTLPAAYFAQRFGLRRTLLAGIAGIAVTEVLRATAAGRYPLAALAFASGCIFSVWAVILAPSIAGAVEEKRRPTAFSVFFATMFAVGIVGNWLAGRLPGWLHGKQPVLFASALLAGISLIPAWWFRPRASAAPDGPAGVWPRGGFLIRFLIPFALWHLATGIFNPFNNVYFARIGFAVDRIGTIFSASQMVQVVAVLFAPLIIRRFGILTGIVWMMVATSAALCGLAAQPQATLAVLTYIAYMAFQWMSEPGLNTLLMNQVNERERSGASSLNLLVAFGAQTLAAFGAGALLAQFGYGPILTGAAAMAAAAALLFKMLLR